MRRFHQLGAGAALLGAIALTACEHAVADMVGPLDAEMLAAAATEVSPGDLVADLGLEPGQQEQVTQDVESLHAAMLALHEALSGHRENMSESEREALHRELEGQMQDVHEKHDALMGSLTEEQRQRFAEHVHARVEGHLEHAAGHAEGGLLERLHGAASPIHR